MGGAVVPTQGTAPLYASWGRRALAWLIDWLIFLIPRMVLMIPFLLALFEQVATARTGPSGESALEPVATGSLGLLVRGSLLLNVGFIAHQSVMTGGPRGQTVGTRAVGIQVREADNLGPIGYGKAAVRYFVGYALM